MAILTVIVLTKDEEASLPVLLHSAEHLDAEFLIIDSGNTNHTIAMANAAGRRECCGSSRMHSQTLQKSQNAQSMLAERKQQAAISSRLDSCLDVRNDQRYYAGSPNL